MTRKYAPRVKRGFYKRKPTFPTDKESLHGRYRPISRRTAHALMCWSHRDFSW